MLAQLTRDMPSGGGWLFEPKWDGCRALVFWHGEKLVVQSRDLRPLGRYFPEVEAGLESNLKPGLVVDGEIVIAGPEGVDFDALLQRIHPAASRINMLARKTPAAFVAFHRAAVQNGAADFGTARRSSAGAPTSRRRSAALISSRSQYPSTRRRSSA